MNNINNLLSDYINIFSSNDNKDNEKEKKIKLLINQIIGEGNLKKNQPNKKKIVGIKTIDNYIENTDLFKEYLLELQKLQKDKEPEKKNDVFLAKLHQFFSSENSEF
jgi:hypothetical protein